MNQPCLSEQPVRITESICLKAVYQTLLIVPLYKLLLVNLNEGRKAMLFIVYISGYMSSSIIVHSISEET